MNHFKDSYPLHDSDTPLSSPGGLDPATYPDDAPSRRYPLYCKTHLCYNCTCKESGMYEVDEEFNPKK